MFDIEYRGGNTVVISTKKTELVIDPNLAVVGLKPLSVKDKVELVTEPRLAVNKNDSLLFIEGPGEYEIGEFSITGITSQRHIDPEEAEKVATIYRIEIDDVRIALLGNIAPKLSEEQLEGLGVVDILIIPVGGGGLTLDSTSAANLTRSIDPKVVIPTHYAHPSLTYEMPQADVEVFAKELAVPVEKIAGKYKIKNVTSLPSVLSVLELDIL